MLFYSILFWSNAALAIIDADQCNNCSESQYEATARNILQSRHGGYIYVYDLTKGNLRKWSVMPEPVAGGRIYDISAEDLLASEVVDCDTAKTAIETNHGSGLVQQHYNAPTTPGFPNPDASVFDFVQTSYYQNQTTRFSSREVGQTSLFKTQG